MMLICLKDGKKIKLDPKTVLKQQKADDQDESTLYQINQEEFNSDSSNSCFSFSENSSSLHEDMELRVDEKPKKKRQRLTHLSPEEKLMRRKLKNRVAAQSARDRKKVKMDDLEVTVKALRDENEKLRKENSLLKEKAQLLLDENRKLLKYKQDSQKSEQVLVKKRKLDNEPVCVEVEGSAVSFSCVSPPQKLLQSQPAQSLVYFFMILALSLTKLNRPALPKIQRLTYHNTNSSSSTSSVLPSQQRLQTTALKLIRLLKLVRQRKMQMNSEQKLKTQAQSANLTLLMSLVTKFLVRKARNKK